MEPSVYCEGSAEETVKNSIENPNSNR